MSDTANYPTSRGYEVNVNYPAYQQPNLVYPAPQEDPDCKVAIAGFGEDSDLIRSKYPRTEFDQTVRILGYVSDIHQVYAWCDVVFLPSYTEVFPYVAVEATAMGVPCVMPDFDLQSYLDDPSLLWTVALGDGEAASRPPRGGWVPSLTHNHGSEC